MVDLGSIIRSGNDKLEAQCCRRLLGRTQVDPAERPARSRVGVIEHCNACHRRHKLLQKLHPLSTYGRLEIREPSAVAARPGKTLDKTAADRIGNAHEDDWNIAAYPAYCSRCGSGMSQDHVGLETHQFFCTGLHSREVAGASVIDSDVVTLAPAQLIERLLERIQSF